MIEVWRLAASDWEEWRRGLPSHDFKWSNWSQLYREWILKNPTSYLGLSMNKEFLRILSIKVPKSSSSSLSWYHHHLFWKCPFLPLYTLGLDVCPYEVPPHIPEYRPFRMWTKHFRVIIHTFFLSFPPLTSHPCHLHLSTGRNQVIPTPSLLCSRCSNHFKLSRLTTSATLSILDYEWMKDFKE